MIFVTVGTQLPFDRLISAVDSWAGRNPSIHVFAQVGPTSLKINNIKHQAFISSRNADEFFEKASLIVAHAGMGSILKALSLGKPIVIFPRRSGLGEHRNDHQLATASWLKGKEGVTVALNDDDLFSALSCSKPHLSAAPIAQFADSIFLSKLKAAIDD